jgi:hypothetical protein
LTRKELESALEDRCVQRIENLGGLALKLVIPGVRGFPDRTVLLPGANIFYAEFKRLKTGRISAQQFEWHKKLTRLGFSVYFIDDDVGFETALKRELNR